MEGVGCLELDYEQVMGKDRSRLAHKYMQRKKVKLVAKIIAFQRNGKKLQFTKSQISISRSDMQRKK